MSASSKKEAPSSSIDVESVRFIDPDVALAAGRYRTVLTSGTRGRCGLRLSCSGSVRIGALRPYATCSQPLAIKPYAAEFRGGLYSTSSLAVARLASGAARDQTTRKSVTL